LAKRTQTRFLARTIEGAKPSEMPGFIRPQLASLRSKAFSGDNWLHEIKYDGYRLQIHLNKGRVTAYTRNGLDWTKRFSAIARAFDVPVERAIFDGEVVVVKDGRTNFSELQAALAAGRQQDMAYYAFDLLYLESFDLRGSAQIERKRILKSLFDETRLAAPILFGEHMLAAGNEVFEAARKLNYEGIVSKKADATYRSDRYEGVAEGQVRAAGEVSGGGVRQGSDGRGRASPRPQARKGPGLHGQGRHRLVANRLERNPQATRHRRQPQIEADEADQGAEGHLGSSRRSSSKLNTATSPATGCCGQARSRDCRRHESELSDLPRRWLGVRKPSRQAMGCRVRPRLRSGRAETDGIEEPDVSQVIVEDEPRRH
jgi:hypothetical protein